MYNKSNLKLTFESQLLDKMFTNNKDTSKIVLLQHNDRDVEDLIEESPHTKIQIESNVSENPKKRWKTRCCDIKLLAIILATILATSILFLLINGFSSVHNIENIKSTLFIEDSNEIKQNDTQICDTPSCVKNAANLLQSMDFNVNPCDDFYQFTCGNWAKQHPRPAGSDIWRWHEVLQTQVNLDIQRFFESSPTSTEPTVISQSRIIYKSCLNADKQAEFSKQLVEQYLSKEFGFPDIISMLIEGKHVSLDKMDWISTIAKVKKTLDIDIIFKFDIIKHPKNVFQKVFKFEKPKDTKPTSPEQIKKYIDFLHPYSNDDVVEDLANRIMKIDKNFTAMLEKENEVNGFVSNNLKNKEDQLRFVETILDKAQQSDVKKRLVIWNRNNRSYCDNVKKFVSKVNKTELALYIWWKIVEEMIKIAEEHYDIGSKGYASAYCANEVNNLMGIIMSYVIAQPDFHTTMKPKLQQMMDEIRASFRDLVEKSDWINDKEKQHILDKSEAMKMDVGFPEWIFNDTHINAFYGHIKFNENSFLENIIKMKSAKLNRKLKLFTSTENIEWETLPSEVISNNHIPTNTMTIPQAVLQYPFYDLGLEALNYGATDLGHEFMHGFDSTGINFDKHGSKANELGIGKEYNKRTKSLIDQYNGFVLPEINEHVNGRKTLDENIADNVGLLLAYNAYQKYIKEQGEEKMILPAFQQYSNEQLFFIAYGNKWCESVDPEYSKRILREDDHSPNKFRVNGVVANMKQFQEAFKCSADSKMVYKNVVQIW